MCVNVGGVYKFYHRCVYAPEPTKMLKWRRQVKLMVTQQPQLSFMVLSTHGQPHSKNSIKDREE